ncbi:uncharacterized protein LOC133186211 [Saccostrea echinata]|uniref:uncharacterized protein LOC133186211 n=1 Tax=Saccostrea echinata TaxID=191078 RepID=UPI002A83723A|nr:uncharacterized protein LOC133186211 [Saccostrea echinata]
MRNLGLRKQLHFVILLSETIRTKEVTCPASVPTMKEVPTCPTTSKALETLMKMKNCESISTLQNCTKASNFRYHCVLQMDLKKLVEVCAPSIYSQGKCVGFDTVGKRIQQIEEKSCQYYKNPCPIGFSSWNSSAYADCYMLLTELEKNDGRTTGSITENVWLIITTVAVAVLVLVLSGMVIIIIIRKQRKKQTGGINDGVFSSKHNVLDISSESRAIAGIFCHVVICRMISGDYAASGQLEVEEKKEVSVNSEEEQSHLCNDTDADIFDTDINATDNDEVFFVLDSEKTEGFDKLSFEKVLTKYELQSVEKIFKKNDIDCIQSFVGMSGDELDNLGLTIGQRKKCLSVIKILNNRNTATVSATNITDRKLSYSLAKNPQSLSNVF